MLKLLKIYRRNRLIGLVYFLTAYYTKLINRESFLNALVKDLPLTSVGYAGYRTKKFLGGWLRFELFGTGKHAKLQSDRISQKEVFAIISYALKKCYHELPLGPVRVFVFPGFNSFVKEKMRGVGGRTPHKGAITVNINPSAKGWKTALKETICHEYAHSVTYRYHKWQTLLDSIVFEGLAEHFRESVVGGKKAPWARAISGKRSREMLGLLKNKLYSKSYKFYSDVFFGGKKYPLWSGYSIGYHIVGGFLEQNKRISWKEIVKIKPKEILASFQKHQH